MATPSINSSSEGNKEMNGQDDHAKASDLSNLETGGSTPSGTTHVLQRKLKARHIQMIAIGSNIGTGLFIGSGKALRNGGPLSLVMGFFLVGIALACMMQCLGEMAVLFPVSGSFASYASRFFDSSLGFAIGWQYWIGWIAVFGAESSAFVVLVNYWLDDPKYTPLWITLFILVNAAIHFSPVKVFGEVEFWVSSLKIVAVVAFIIVTWCIMGGAGPDGYVHGGEYWLLPGLENGVANGFRGFGSVFVAAAFATGGPEMVGIAAAESQAPRHNLPRAIRTLMWRIFIFYVVSMLFLTFVVPYDNPNLLGGSSVNSSPFVLAIKIAGIQVLPDILNAVIIVCVISVGSSSIYICSRILKGLAADGHAWKGFERTDSHGRPYMALAFSGAAAIIVSYINCSSTGSIVFSWFSSVSGIVFFLAWGIIIACNWRFHRALKAQGDTVLLEKYSFRALWWPWTSIVGFILIAFALICQFVVSITPVTGSPSAEVFFSNFLGGPIFLVLWLGHKAITRSKMIPLDKIDLQTGRRAEDPEEIEIMEKYAAMSKGRKALSYVQF